MTRPASVTGQTLSDLAQALEAGDTTSRALVERALDRISDPDGQGKTSFLSVKTDEALQAADKTDRLRAEGKAPSRFAGIPISVKDLFDLTGDITRAGSLARSSMPAATADAPVIARLKSAGFIPVGRTNMTELAFSGLGLNPHFGTPLSPWQRKKQHIAGGSSSGAAASVADGMAAAGIGTDTGGSCRIPAAFCSLVGYKPTSARIPSSGIVPLSPSLDVAGPIANSVACVRSLFQIMSGTARDHLPLPQPEQMRLAVPENYFLSDLHPDIAHAFNGALDLLEKNGVTLTRIQLNSLNRLNEMAAIGSLPAIEGYRLHHALLEITNPSVDPRVATRLRPGGDASADDYAELLRLRRCFIDEIKAELEPFNALICPTVAIPPPRLSDLVSDDAYIRINRLVLRNTSAINMMDGCSISLPVSRPGNPPCGLMLFAIAGRDEMLLDLASVLEPLINQ
jgi:aspartyl-tRNA(Asn)/glutamyl-tRNA(Gln) amidotransferase subunit A